MLGVYFFYHLFFNSSFSTTAMPDLSLTQWPVCYSLHLFSPTAELSQSPFVWPRIDVFCVLMRSVCKSHLFIPFPTQQHFTSCSNRKGMWNAEPDSPARLTSTESTHLLKPVQTKPAGSEASNELHLSVAGGLSFLCTAFIAGWDDAPVAGASVYVVVGQRLRRIAELGHAFMICVLALASR